MLGRIVVVGCGLIGGSIVKGLRERKGARWLGVIDRSSVLDDARAWVDAAAEPDSGDAQRLLAEADLVVLAAPVAVIVAGLAAMLDRLSEGAASTDCGSVKRPMAAVAAWHRRGTRFVPGHPMAGREVGGFAMSSSTLLDGCRWYLDPAVAASDARQRVELLVRALGATPVETNAADHDRAMAYVSHAPQIVASALVDAAAAAGVIIDAGPGFRDTTRIAGGPEAIWRDILSANGANVVQAIEAVIERLTLARDELARRPPTASEAASPRPLVTEGRTLDQTLQMLERARRAKTE